MEMSDEGDWGGETTAARWDAIHVVCGFAASLLFLGTWQNAAVVGFGIAGGLAAFGTFFVPSQKARQALTMVAGMCMVVVAIFFWVAPSFQEGFHYYDGASSGYPTFYFRISPLVGVVYLLWGITCVVACFSLPGSQLYAFVPESFQPFVGRFFASFLFFVYGLIFCIETRGEWGAYLFVLSPISSVCITIGAILLGVNCASFRDQSLSSIAAVMVAFFLILDAFVPLMTGYHQYFFGDFLVAWVHYASIVSQAFGFAYWWVIVSLDSSLTGKLPESSGGMMVESKGGGEGRGQWPVELCDCCGDGCDVCLWGTFCGCCMHGQTEETFETGKSNEPCEVHCSGSCWLTYCLGICYCSWVLPCLLRGRIRQRKDIEGNPIGDCVTTVCCPWCVAIQDYRTVKHGSGPYIEVN